MEALFNETGLSFSQKTPRILSQFIEPEPMKFARIILEILIGVFGIGGNFLVCIVIGTRKRLQTVGNIFVFNLAIADLGVLIICLPLVILNADFYYSWPFGDVGCKILLPLTDIFYGVSIGSIVGISFHRYRMIVHCMGRQLSASKAKVMVLLIWILSYVLFVFPLHFVVEASSLNGKKICKAKWPRPIHRQLHVVFVSTLYYVLPLCLITSTYLRIRRKLSADSFLTSQVLDDATSTVKARLDQNKKALKILTPVVVAFSLLMCPINAIRLAAAFGENLHQTFVYLRLVYNISVVLLLTNSSINCVIYAVVNKDFRQEFKRILCCGCLKRMYEAMPSPRSRLPSAPRPHPRLYSLYSTTDPKTVEEMLSHDVETQDDGEQGRVSRLLKKLNRYEVRNLMEDKEYAETVHYSTFGENLTIVVR